MRKLPSVGIDDRKRTRRLRVTAFAILTLLLIASPVLYEATLVCLASWQTAFGHIHPGRDPGPGLPFRRSPWLSSGPRGVELWSLSRYQVEVAVRASVRRVLDGRSGPAPAAMLSASRADGQDSARPEVSPQSAPAGLEEAGLPSIILGSGRAEPETFPRASLRGQSQQKLAGIVLCKVVHDGTRRVDSRS